MATNEERREVAEIMRDGTRFSVSSCAVASRLGLECEEFETCAECESMLADRLADLIEPEERTCQALCVKHGPLFDVLQFSCCGYEWAENRTDRGATEPDPNYCPNCGAKVVE